MASEALCTTRPPRSCQLSTSSLLTPSEAKQLWLAADDDGSATSCPWGLCTLFMAIRYVNEFDGPCLFLVLTCHVDLMHLSDKTVSQRSYCYWYVLRSALPVRFVKLDM
jgi:hypothetical protein